MKLHVKHNHGGFVFDKVCSFENIKDLAKEINKVLKSFSALDCNEATVNFEIEYDGSLIKKSIFITDFRSADKVMDKFIRGLEYIWPEMR